MYATDIGGKVTTAYRGTLIGRSRENCAESYQYRVRVCTLFFIKLKPISKINRVIPVIRAFIDNVTLQPWRKYTNTNNTPFLGGLCIIAYNQTQ